jgi:hypothetical protein
LLLRDFGLSERLSRAFFCVDAWRLMGLGRGYTFEFELG